MFTRRIDALRTRLAVLARQAADFWKRHGQDAEHGGFHGTLDRVGRPTAPTDKGLIQQARHLWSMATWYEYKEQTADVRALADNLYSFASNHFYDDASGEYAYLVDRTGRVVEPKHVLYAQSFAIYAFAQYARTFAHAPARDRALELFRKIDARAHDARYGGYRQLDDAPWLPPGCEKETNTHIHLMEAYSPLYTLTADSVVGERLEELTRLVTSKMLQPQGYVHKGFALDWTPVGDKWVSYGHDLETYWLLDEAARALGRPLDPTILEPARRMAINSANWGHDAAHGGFFEGGPVGQAPSGREKIWWIQAEAIPALFRLFEQTGEEVWLQRLEGTVEFIEQKQVNRETGEWFWGVLADGSVGPRGDSMGEQWKASYHVLRALVFTERWMTEWLGAQRG
jgi:cellobiose epimerase